MGTHHNKRDSKGRVSIPAPFRSVLKGTNNADAPVSLIVRPSHQRACIEGWSSAEFRRLAGPIEQYDTFSEEQEDLAAVLYSQATPLECDREGRILLPDTLVRHAHLEDLVTFLGLGHKFEIWEPAGAERRVAEARERVRTRGLTLPALVRAALPSDARPA